MKNNFEICGKLSREPITVTLMNKEYVLILISDYCWGQHAYALRWSVILLQNRIEMNTVVLILSQGSSFFISSYCEMYSIDTHKRKFMPLLIYNCLQLWKFYPTFTPAGVLRVLKTARTNLVNECVRLLETRARERSCTENARRGKFPPRGNTVCVYTPRKLTFIFSTLEDTSLPWIFRDYYLVRADARTALMSRRVVVVVVHFEIARRKL